jgi:hypothetical protein
VPLGLVPFEGADHEREPILTGEQPDGDLGLQPPLFGEPQLAEPVPRVGLELQRGHVVEHEAGWVKPGVRPHAADSSCRNACFA